MKKKPVMNAVLCGVALFAVLMGASLLALYYWFFLQAYRDGQRQGPPPAGSAAAKRIEQRDGKDR
jgi:hypothetical protein